MLINQNSQNNAPIQQSPQNQKQFVTVVTKNNVDRRKINSVIKQYVIHGTDKSMRNIDIIPSLMPGGGANFPSESNVKSYYTLSHISSIEQNGINY